MALRTDASQRKSKRQERSTQASTVEIAWSTLELDTRPRGKSPFSKNAGTAPRDAKARASAFSEPLDDRTDETVRSRKSSWFARLLQGLDEPRWRALVIACSAITGGLIALLVLNQTSRLPRFPSSASTHHAVSAPAPSDFAIASTDYIELDPSTEAFTGAPDTFSPEPPSSSVTMTPAVSTASERATRAPPPRVGRKHLRPKGKTLERHAVDLLARGAFAEATEVYRELHRLYPERGYFEKTATLIEQSEQQRPDASGTRRPPPMK